jgi:hypothetical protein
MKGRGQQKGDAVGRGTWESSLLKLPSAKFFYRKRQIGTKNEKEAKSRAGGRLFKYRNAAGGGAKSEYRSAQVARPKLRRASPGMVQGKRLKRRPFPCYPIPALNANREWGVGPNQSIKRGQIKLPNPAYSDVSRLTS